MRCGQPDGPGSGSATFPLRVCDVHPLLANGAHGPLATKLAGYDQGIPDDLSATTSSRCSDGEASINISAGLIAPPLGNGDADIVDAGYSGDGVGAYSVEVPVLANDTDVNGPDPSEVTSTGVLDVVDLDGVIEVDGAPAGTATVVDLLPVDGHEGDLIRFTPADGFSGPVPVQYRVCEDPATQDPPYDEPDDPNTPQIEGLPFCGLGVLSLFVVPNDAPDAVDDAVLTSSIAPVVDFEADANDTDPQGETITCTAGALVAVPDGLVESASIDEQCRVDAPPVLGAEGVATLTYEACDVHPLSQPTFPASPYGADGRSPGDITSRCTTASIAIEIVAPALDDPGLFELDPPPTCGADEATGDQDEPLPIEVLGNDSDLDFVGDPSPLATTNAGIEEGEGVTTEGGHGDGRRRRPRALRAARRVHGHRLLPVLGPGRRRPRLLGRGPRRGGRRSSSTRPSPPIRPIRPTRHRAGRGGGTGTAIRRVRQRVGATATAVSPARAPDAARCSRWPPCSSPSAAAWWRSPPSAAAPPEVRPPASRLRPGSR